MGLRMIGPRVGRGWSWLGVWLALVVKLSCEAYTS